MTSAWSSSDHGELPIASSPYGLSTSLYARGSNVDSTSSPKASVAPFRPGPPITMTERPSSASSDTSLALMTAGATGAVHAFQRPAAAMACSAAWRSSAVARACFGDEVVDHYARMAEVELTAFDAAVTDWELRRSFERM